eukprot:2100437-Amphidinium_carterae.1
MFLSFFLLSFPGRDSHGGRCGASGFARAVYIFLHIIVVMLVSLFFLFVVYFVSTCSPARLGTALKASAPRAHWERNGV